MRRYVRIGWNYYNTIITLPLFLRYETIAAFTASFETFFLEPFLNYSMLLELFLNHF